MLATGCGEQPSQEPARETGRLEFADPIEIRVPATVSIPVGGGPPVDVVAGDEGVWVTVDRGARDSRALRIDPATDRVVASVPVEGSGAVWVLALEGLDSPGDVVRVDPESGRVRAEALNTGAGPGGLWITGCVDCDGYRSTFFMQEIETGANAPVGPRIALRKMGSSPLFVGHDSVWFLGYGEDEGTVAIRLDPETHAVEELLRLGDFVHRGTAFDREHMAIWIARAAPASVVRVALDGPS
jgi:hypothetical protein